MEIREGKVLRFKTMNVCAALLDRGGVEESQEVVWLPNVHETDGPWAVHAAGVRDCTQQWGHGLCLMVGPWDVVGDGAKACTHQWGRG